MPANPALFQFNAALVRRPSKSVVDGLRANGGDGPAYGGVRSEHDAYIAALRAAGVDVTILPALEGFPDGVFVEDPALVFPEGAILLRSSAPSRLGEVAEIAPVLRKLFDNVAALPAPGFAEGGDILATRDKIMIGLSSRTDRAGAEGLKTCLSRFGRASEIVKTPEGVLHFKSDCSLIGEETILTTARLAQSGVFKGFEQIIVPRGEEPAANALRVNDVVMAGSDFPRTIELLSRRGYDVVALNTSHIGKIDAGLSCMSLRWRDGAQGFS